MKKFFLPLALLVCGVIFESGCTNASKIIVVGLRAELTGIERASDGSTTVTWHINNPNVAAYLVASTNQKIYLNDILVGSTDDPAPMAVPAQNKAGKTSKLIVAGPAADRLLGELAGHGPANYRVESSIVVVLYGDSSEKGSFTSTGSVAVTTK